MADPPKNHQNSGHQWAESTHGCSEFEHTEDRDAGFTGLIEYTCYLQARVEEGRSLLQRVTHALELTAPWQHQDGHRIRSANGMGQRQYRQGARRASSLPDELPPQRRS